HRPPTTLKRPGKPFPFHLIWRYVAMKWLWTFLLNYLLEHLARHLVFDIQATALEEEADRLAQLQAKAAELRVQGFVDEAEKLLAAARGLTPPDAMVLTGPTPAETSAPLSLPGVTPDPDSSPVAPHDPVPPADTQTQPRRGRRKAAPRAQQCSSSAPPTQTS